jgi:hypothetical protein
MKNSRTPLSDVAYAVALASLQEMTPVRLSRLIRDRVIATGGLMSDAPPGAAPEG